MLCNLCSKCFPWAREEVACSAYTAARLPAPGNYLQNKSIGTKKKKPQSTVVRSPFERRGLESQGPPTSGPPLLPNTPGPAAQNAPTSPSLISTPSPHSGCSPSPDTQAPFHFSPESVGRAHGRLPSAHPALTVGQEPICRPVPV